MAAPLEAGDGALRPVASLTERRLRASQLPADTRPLPTVDQYDALLPSRLNHRLRQVKELAMPTKPAPNLALPRRRGLTEEAARTAVDQACRMLRLPTVRAQFPDTADQAAAQQMSYSGSSPSSLSRSAMTAPDGAPNAASAPHSSRGRSRCARSTSTRTRTSTPP